MRRWMVGVAVTVGSAIGASTASHAQFSPGPLSRAHESISGPLDCFRCHEPRRATTPERCLECHRELATRIESGSGYHGRMQAAERNRCGTCHAEHGGKDARLIAWPGGRREAFAHDRTGFTLTGKHASLACAACHQPRHVRDPAVRRSASLELETTHLGLSTRCTDCHEDPHRRQFDQAGKAADCARCHDAEGWKPAHFDHATARFRLDGRHTALRCADCHYSSNSDGARVEAGAPGAAVVYRPLRFESCAACHADPHQARFGQECSQCHATAGWERVETARFDHSRTRFPLVGRHRQAACRACHADERKAADKRASSRGSGFRYRPLAFAACTDCHRDPHGARMGTDCAACHSPVGWQRIAAGAFDHSRTRYSLEGRHSGLACEKCHRPNAPLAPLAHGKCEDCHADAHAGRLASRADRGTCEACHSVEGFVPARFGPAQHAAARFPLEGAHRAVACVVCHDPAHGRVRAGQATAPVEQKLANDTSSFEFRFTSQTCNACHADPHAGQFATESGERGTNAGRRGNGTDCGRCHELETWQIARFDHSKTRFPLDGAHRRADCEACHRPVTIAGRTVIRYRPLETACRACHAEPVRQQVR